MALLEVQDLKVYYKTRHGQARAVDGVSFSVHKGEYVGLVGESGCGKTTVAKAILGILPPNAIVPGGRILFKERNLLSMSPREMRRIRWKEISTVPQGAMNSLDPVYRVGEHMVEVMRAHQAMSRAEALQRAGKLFEQVGLDRKQLQRYPHQLSGGMRQRVMIANALTLDPDLIVADEPTTGLDVIVQDQIFELLNHLQRSLKKAMILITHDMPLVAENCDRLIVMYAGKVVEDGPTSQVLQMPFHPYTLGLQNAFPELHSVTRSSIAIPGAPPDLTKPPPGCRFHTRCPFATRFCLEHEPPLIEVVPGRRSACHYVDQIEEFREMAKSPATWERRAMGQEIQMRWDEQEYAKTSPNYEET